MSIADATYDRAKRSFGAAIYENAARDAYTAALNAARAVVFDKSGIAPKTHSGTRSKFHDLLHGGLAFDANLAKFLSEGFDTKQGIDYGPEVAYVTREQRKTT
ncbi:HEPN domain-containing protein [Bradyrhizobium sp.]|uniref:HEPN domain-containing protein n=1 Tax=Bradyrhizobium sp. TaxID=376 RepID=UPI001EC6B24F|nr:HEPN domain-containing protein [Bradyrhizobium sp.]MBV9979012.1 HEPN domain-containing protein [Bradyrhizobium sp.]